MCVWGGGMTREAKGEEGELNRSLASLVVACRRRAERGGTTGGRPPPLIPLSVAKAGRNHLNEEITPLLPTGIGKRYTQTISNLEHAALLS